MAEIIACSYGNDYRSEVREGDTLRVLAQNPTEDTWAATLSIKTSLTGSTLATASLSEYTGEKVQDREWGLSVDYDTSTLPLLPNTRYLLVVEMTSGAKKTDRITSVDVLPQG